MSPYFNQRRKINSIRFTQNSSKCNNHNLNISLLTKLHTQRHFIFIFENAPKIVAPLVEKFRFPANLTQGKRLRVICTVAEGDLPLEVIWKKNGIPILINPGAQGNNVQVRVTRFYPFSLSNAIKKKNFIRFEHSLTSVSNSFILRTL